MPVYSFICEKCNSKFEVKNSIEHAGVKPKCPDCRSKKHVYRDYQSDNVSVAEGPKTLGSLADRNSSKFSDDQKQFLKDKLEPPKQPSKFKRYEP